MEKPSELTGRILIASPMLRDPNFRQTVILMLSKSDEPAIGVVINRRSDKTVCDLWETVFQKKAISKQMLYLGGPIFGPLIVLHTHCEFADTECLPGIYYTTQKEHIEAIVDKDLQPYRLFVGNAGWEELQLAQEIQQGVWHTLPATLDYVFTSDEDIWEKLLWEAGNNIISDMLQRSSLPKDPTVN